LFYFSLKGRAVPHERQQSQPFRTEWTLEVQKCLLSLSIATISHEKSLVDAKNGCKKKMELVVENRRKKAFYQSDPFVETSKMGSFFLRIVVHDLLNKHSKLKQMPGPTSDPLAVHIVAFQ
jgi:hypothetical protein